MHELSIAMSMVDVACDELLRLGAARVEAVHLRLGPLSGVVKEALLSAYGLAVEGTPLEGSRLVIQDVPVEVDCPLCGVPRPVESIAEMRCRVCGTLSPNVVRGRELEIFAMEVSDEQPAAVG